jgi:sugar-specific transcriptional regulator TrmB
MMANKLNSKTLLDVLQSVGLSEKESRLYLTLLEAGELSLSKLATQAKLKRGITYELVKKLVDKGLVSLLETGKKMVAQAQSPANLNLLAEKQEHEVKRVQAQLETAVDELKNAYKLAHAKPTVRYLLGDTTLNEVQEDIVKRKADLYMIISRAYRKDSAKREMVRKHVVARAKKGIETFAITTDVPDANRDPKVDRERKVDRKWIGEEEYAGSVQINTYGDRVSFVDYERDLGVIIEDSRIARAVRDLLIALRKRL